MTHFHERVQPARGAERSRAVAEGLLRRTTELAERWHQELETHLRLRPQNVFPGSQLLNGMPEVIQWIAGPLRNGRGLGPAQGESLHALAGYWRRSGYSIEESLLHVRILGRILHEALRAEIRRLPQDMPAAAGAALAELLCGSLGRIETVLVGAYRDAEEERFAEFGGTLAHEIRGQLSAAMAAAEVLRVSRGNDSEEAATRLAEAIDRINGAVEAASELETAVRTFSRIPGSETEPEARAT